MGGIFYEGISQRDFFLEIGRLIIIIVSIIIIGSNLRRVKLVNFFIILGALLLVSSDNLILVYLGFELQSLGFFVLLGGDEFKKKVRSVEAALKFFILSVVSSAVFLLGVVFIFGFVGDISLLGGGFLNQAYLERIGRLFIVIAFLFKLTIVPFHF